MGENCLERMERIDAKTKIATFMAKEKQPYEFKIKYAEMRAREFVSECDARGLNYHVSVGGLDSITLFLFLKSRGIDVPGISVSYLEDVSIQRIHKALGLERLKSSVRYVDDNGIEHRWSKPAILQEFGFPVLSKEIAGKIETLANPTEKNKTVRHAIVTGETGAYGGFQKNSRMKLSQKWLEKFGGYANEEEGTDYQTPPFDVSSKCCYYLKEKPCDEWAKAHNSVPFMGLMASEGGRRAKSLRINGCNYFGKSSIRSAPFAIFDRDSLLRLVLELDARWKSGWKEEFYERGVREGRLDPNFKMPDSIIPEIYGDIVPDENGKLHTTKAQRTGCTMCGFGIHLEKRPHRFDLLRERAPKEWHYWMYECCTDKVTGEKYGWSMVLDYIGVEYL
ncbi:MAG: hypothetical protein KHX30_10675 [Clostridium sp.]|nr:hypothetical protein [Clostridium sp.]